MGVAGYEDEVFLHVVIVVRNVEDAFFSPRRQVVIHEQSTGHITRTELAWMVLGWAFMPVYYMNERHFSSTEMGILMSVLGASATICSYIVPALSDRLGRRTVVVVFSLIGALTPLAALYFDGPFWMLCVILFLTWSASGVAPIFMATIPSETVPAHRIAACVGLVMGMGEIVGGVLSPIAGGWLADIAGLSAPLMLQAACAVVVGLLGLWLHETAPLRAKHSQQNGLTVKEATRP